VLGSGCEEQACFHSSYVAGRAMSLGELCRWASHVAERAMFPLEPCFRASHDNGRWDCRSCGEMGQGTGKCPRRTDQINLQGIDQIAANLPEAR
jgi:hypothetical protein